MANLDCEAAFNQEMAALNGLNDKVEQIVKFVGYDETDPLKTLSLKIDPAVRRTNGSQPQEGSALSARPENPSAST